MLNRFILRTKPKFVRSISLHDNMAQTALHRWHVEHGGKMVPFAGYELPVQYREGLMKEHLHCREKSSLFDVSHMGQVKIRGKDRHEFIERVTVLDIQTLKDGEAGLSLITNPQGGIKDDTVITRNEDHIYMVLNAGCKEKDLEHLNAVLTSEFANKDVHIEYMSEQALVAVQGPKTQYVLEKILDCSLKDQLFMNSVVRDIPKLNTKAITTRCGYTGEDGFEISVPNKMAEQLGDLILSTTDSEGNKIVKPAGLGARDSLRLEAGLCLYGHEMDESISPVEAVLQWTISKRRKEEGGFIGYEAYKEKRKKGAVKQKRCGYVYKDKGAVARDGSEVFDMEGNHVGRVTSGSFGPSVGKNIGMCYVDTKFFKPGNELQVKVRDRLYPITVTKMPLTEPGYYRG